MASRIRNFFDSILYTRVPSTLEAPTPGLATPGPFGLLERFLDAPVSNDPLYLSNQTFGQKIRRFLWFATPVVLALSGIVVAFAMVSRADHRPKDLTPIRGAQFDR